MPINFGNEKITETITSNGIEIRRFDLPHVSKAGQQVGVESLGIYEVREQEDKLPAIIEVKIFAPFAAKGEASHTLPKAREQFKERYETALKNAGLTIELAKFSEQSGKFILKGTSIEAVAKVIEDAKLCPKGFAVRAEAFQNEVLHPGSNAAADYSSLTTYAGMHERLNTIRKFTSKAPPYTVA
jgi:hypothetical protein